MPTYHEVLQGYRRQKKHLKEIMASYAKLSPKVKMGCRIVEARNLLELVKEQGDREQLNEMKKLFADRRLGVIQMACDCTSSSCDWSQEDSYGEIDSCNCLEQNVICRGVFVYVTLPHGRTLYGGSHINRRGAS